MKYLEKIKQFDANTTIQEIVNFIADACDETATASAVQPADIQTSQIIMDALIDAEKAIADIIAANNFAVFYFFQVNSILRKVETPTIKMPTTDTPKTLREKLKNIRAAQEAETVRQARLREFVLASMQALKELDELKAQNFSLHDPGNGRITEMVERGYAACKALGYLFAEEESDEPGEDELERLRRITK